MHLYYVMEKRVWNVNPKYVQSRSLFLIVEPENHSPKHSKHTLFLIIFFFDIYLEKG